MKTTASESSNQQIALKQHLNKPDPLIASHRLGRFCVMACAGSAAIGGLLTFTDSKNWKVWATIAGCSAIGCLYSKQKQREADERLSEMRGINESKATREGVLSIIDKFMTEAYKANKSGTGQTDSLKLIEGGGFGDVLKLTLDDSGCHVAIKQVSLFDENGTYQGAKLKHTNREIGYLLELKGPHLVEFYGYHQSADGILLVMECCSKDLDTAQRENLPGVEKLKAAAQCNSALAFVHSKGLIFRDITMTNYLLNTKDCWVLCDPAFVCKTGEIGVGFGGTPEYMSPEVACGEAPSIGSDSWGMGIVIHLLSHTITTFDQCFAKLGSGQNLVTYNFRTPEKMHAKLGETFDSLNPGDKCIPPYKELMDADPTDLTTTKRLSVNNQLVAIGAPMLREKAGERLTPQNAEPLLHAALGA